MIVQVASSKAGIQTQVCLTPDFVHIALLHAVATIHFETSPLTPATSQSPPASASVDSVMVRDGDGGVEAAVGLFGFSASYTGNTKQPSLSVHSYHFLHRSV